MTSHNVRVHALLLVLAILLLLPTHAAAQNSAPPGEDIAVVVYQPTQLNWEPQIQYDSVSLRVVGPGGFVEEKFFGLDRPVFNLPAAPGDGRYFYELVFGRTPDAKFAEAFGQALASGAIGEDGRTTDPGLTAGIDALRATYSGSFLIAAGQIVRPDLMEAAPQASVKLATDLSGTQLSTPLLLITGNATIRDSLCVGFDCLDNESFSFDTIKLKENNLRILFDDTSTAAGFAANDWQLTANDSVSGGANKFSIEDITGAKVPFTLTAGAPSNSLFVSSSGRVGLRTSTPVLDLHIATGNTPATRLEQNSSGGFTAQTWDVAGNEANFFIRDVTGGSRLPFRIRPGAPTSSIDISASGNVGIGTSSPGTLLHLRSTSAAPKMTLADASGGSERGGVLTGSWGGNGIMFDSVAAGGWVYMGLQPDGGKATNFAAYTGGVERFRINQFGNVGIGTTAPTATLSVNGGAQKPGGGSWGVFSDKRLKNTKGSFTSGLQALLKLQPLRYEYKPDNALGITSKGEHIGFEAQSVQEIIPEAVTRTDNGYLVIDNDPILWTMLNAIKEQSKEIAQLKEQIKRLLPAASQPAAITGVEQSLASAAR